MVMKNGVHIWIYVCVVGVGVILDICPSFNSNQSSFFFTLLFNLTYSIWVSSWKLNHSVKHCSLQSSWVFVLLWWHHRIQPRHGWSRNLVARGSLTKESRKVRFFHPLFQLYITMMPRFEREGNAVTADLLLCHCFLPWQTLDILT